MSDKSKTLVGEAARRLNERIASTLRLNNARKELVKDVDAEQIEICREYLAAKPNSQSTKEE